MVAPQTVSKGAGWLLAEMLLFFVPAAMILMQNPQMFGLLGLKLLAIIVVGTILVMAATALTIDVLFRWRQRHETR
jgi:holin-like protein